MTPSGGAPVPIAPPLPLPAAVASTYADTCVERESGDLAGAVVTVRRHGAGARIAVYWSDGQLRGPARATATVAPDGRMRFVARTPDGALRFAGRLAGHRLTGRLTLPWQTRPMPVLLVARRRPEALAPTRPCRRWPAPAAAASPGNVSRPSRL